MTFPVTGTDKLDQNEPQNYIRANDAADHAQRMANDSVSIDVAAGGTITISDADSRIAYLYRLTGAPAGAFTVDFPNRPKYFQIKNESGQTATIDSVGGATSPPTVLDGNTSDFRIRFLSSVWEVELSQGAPSVPAADKKKIVIVALTSSTGSVVTGTAIETLMWLEGTFNLNEVKASLTTAATSGGPVTVDINVNASTILSTKLTIDNTEKTSNTAATPPVISSSTINEDDEITFDVDIAGATAAGLKVWLVGEFS